MQKITASVLHDTKCFLGESPMWHSKRKSCFWTDIEGLGFYEYARESRSVTFYGTRYRVTLIIQSDDEHLLLGMHGGIAKLDLNTKQLHWILDVEKEHLNHRCNDGACDSKGRLWIGTMDMDFKPEAGALYCVNENRVLEKN